MIAWPGVFRLLVVLLHPILWRFIIISYRPLGPAIVSCHSPVFPVVSMRLNQEVMAAATQVLSRRGAPRRGSPQSPSCPPGPNATGGRGVAPRWGAGSGVDCPSTGRQVFDRPFMSSSRLQTNRVGHQRPSSHLSSATRMVRKGIGRRTVCRPPHSPCGLQVRGPSESASGQKQGFTVHGYRARDCLEISKHVR
jgi:hypothetical protein